MPTSLEDQIKSKWGQYGDWKAADQDQVKVLADLFRRQGVTDLGQFKLQAREYETPERTIEGESGALTTPASKGVAFDAFDGDKKLNFLGNANVDGTLSDGPADPLAFEHGSTLRNANELGWSARGHGSTSFRVMQGPDGEPVVVPTWQSSSQSDLELARGTAMVAAVGVGGAMAAGASSAGAGATAAAGSTAAGAGTWEAAIVAAGKSAAINAGMTLARGGSLGDALKAGAIGAVTGGAGGALAAQGVNPIIAGAATGGAGAALRGGDGSAILTGAATGALSGAGRDGGITGNSIIDRAVVGAGNSLIRGGSARDALTGAATGAAGDYLSSGQAGTASNLPGDNVTGNQSGGGNVFTGDEDFDLGALDMGDFQFTTDSFGTDMSGGFATGQDDYVDPYGPGSGRGGDTLSAMGAGNDTGAGSSDGSSALGKLANGVGSFITQNRLAPSLLNMAGGIIGRYADGRAAQELTEEQRQRYLAGYKSGQGLSLWRTKKGG